MEVCNIAVLEGKFRIITVRDYDRLDHTRDVMWINVGLFV